MKLNENTTLEEFMEVPTGTMFFHIGKPYIWVKSKGRWDDYTWNCDSLDGKLKGYVTAYSNRSVTVLMDSPLQKAIFGVDPL